MLLVQLCQLLPPPHLLLLPAHCTRKTQLVREVRVDAHYTRNTLAMPSRLYLNLVTLMALLI
jgi:hypothetical protein